MKTLILTLVFAAFTLVTYAQQGNGWATQRTSSQRAYSQTREMRTKLNLNDSQIKKVYDINVKINAKYDLVDQNVKSSGLQHQIAMNKLGSERDTLMEEVLDGKQFLLYMKKN